MKYVDLYTLTRSQVPATIGEYIELTRFPPRPDTRIIPISGTDYTDDRVTQITNTVVSCKVYRLFETGKPERLVAIDPDLVDTIKFVALDKVKAQLADEKFRVDELTAKLSISDHQLTKAEIMCSELKTYLDYTPIWKLVWDRLTK